MCFSLVTVHFIIPLVFISELLMLSSTSCWCGITAHLLSGRVSSSLMAQGLLWILHLHCCCYDNSRWTGLIETSTRLWNVKMYLSLPAGPHNILISFISVLHIVSGSRVGGFSITTCRPFCLESCSLGECCYPLYFNGCVSHFTQWQIKL